MNWKKSIRTKRLGISTNWSKGRPKKPLENKENILIDGLMKKKRTVNTVKDSERSIDLKTYQQIYKNEK